ncbi:MAG: hypothetical protein CM1200mP16_08070 [Nitrospina sp.]|nr:MAG: hypothetical protein CM1200mP16_08070 [Nitrospina sp.]
MIVHVSEPEAARAILEGPKQGLPIYGETCPQYLFLTAEDLDKNGMEGAKYCCSRLQETRVTGSNMAWVKERDLPYFPLITLLIVMMKVASSTLEQPPPLKNRKRCPRH